MITDAGRSGEAGLASPIVLIRTATAADAEALRTIYNLEVETSTATFDLVPRSLDEQLLWQRAREGAYTILVAVDDDSEIVGFASLSPYRSRPAYSTSAEDSVYVRRDAHGRGVGTALMTELVRQAADRGFHALFARIAGNNPASVALHTSVGFSVVGVEKEVGRKFGRWLDVTLMQRLL
jgi:L-amino acid N-acyltransferase YncA